MKHRVNWDFEMDGKAFKEGDEIDLTKEQVASLGGSRVVTQSKEVPASTEKEDAERAAAEAEQKKRAAAEREQLEKDAIAQAEKQKGEEPAKKSSK